MADDKGKGAPFAPGKNEGKTLTAEPPATTATKVQAAPVAATTGQAERTVIARGTEFQGSMVSSCGITLDGKLRGELRAPSLVLNATGVIDGNVEVEELTSCGSLAGQIKAKNVTLSGKVDDRTVIRAETLEVKLAQPGNAMQVSFGNCELKVGDITAAKPTAPPMPSKGPTKPGNDRGL